MKKKNINSIDINVPLLEKLTIVFAVIIVVVTIGLGTYAYFNVTKESDINFVMISYDPDDPFVPDGDFSMRLYEHDNNVEVNSRTYNNVVPGDKLDKDPTIVNTGINAMWVRLNVIFTNASNWMEVSNKHHLNGPIDLLKGISSDWYYSTEGTIVAGDNILYRFYYKNGLNSGRRAVLFNEVDIPSQFDEQDMQKLSTFQIKVTADAIQKEGTGNSCREAFKNYWSMDED